MGFSSTGAGGVEGVGVGVGGVEGVGGTTGGLEGGVEGVGVEASPSGEEGVVNLGSRLRSIDEESVELSI